MRSVLSQTLEDWVHVIVNDGGDPETVNFLIRCERDAYRERVIVVHHAESKGMQHASNAGIAASASDYLVIHDDDDSWQPDFLEKTVEALESEPEDSLIRAVATQSNQIFEEVLLDGQLVETGRRIYEPYETVTLDALLRGNLFPPIALLYRRDVHEKVGLFRQEFDVLGDYDFNLRLIRHFDILVLDEPCANYHWREHSFGNTVTRQRSVHRKMLSRLKNAYARDVLDRSPEAIGMLDKVPMPPPQEPPQVHFKLRDTEPVFERELPDFEALYDFDVLSLDIFDTALLRRTYQPTDLFDSLEEKAVEQLGLPPRPYALARKEAEVRAREGADGGEVTIDAIYLKMGDRIPISPDTQRSLLRLELELERQCLYPDPRWLALYRDYRQRGKRVIFLSDMYWTTAMLEELLTEFGFEAPEVFVSSECACSKHDGSLQPFVLEKLKLRAERVLHVGDNFLSDDARCRQAGMQTFHWEDRFVYRPWAIQVNTPPRATDDLFSRQLIGQVRRLELVQPLDRSPDPLMERLGREVAGPLYYCFLNWLVKTARKDGIQHLFFLGRDGYYWDKTLQVLDQEHDLGLDFTYLDASRKVFAFASFKCLDETAIAFLSTPNPRLRVRDFIDRTGLESHRFEKEIRSAGFSSPGEVLTSDLGGSFLQKDSRNRLRALFTLIELPLLDRFKRCRRGVRHSLDAKGFDPKHSAIVDIGWQGTSANALARVLGLSMPDSLKAYYFGTWPGIKNCSPAVCPRSFFVHAGEPQDLANLLFESVNFFETLHTAPFPCLVDYAAEANDGYRPIFSTCERSGLNKKEQGALWNGVETFLGTVSTGPFPFSGDAQGLNYIERVLHRILREPSPAERQRIGSIMHSEGYGLEVNKPLIMPASPTMNGEEIMKGYWSSNWKRGFLAQLDQRQREFVWAKLARAPTHPIHPRSVKKATPWHKHVYRFYRRVLGDPKYTRQK